MDSSTLTTLIAEMRDDYQLPPYLSDDVIGRALTRADARLTQLRPDTEAVDETTSGTFFVKMYAYYMLCKKGDEFEKDYAADLLSWQLNAEVTDDE